MFIFWVAFCVHVSFFVVFLSIHNMNLCHGGCFAFLCVFVCFAVTYVWPLCWHLTRYLLKDLPMCFSIQQGQSKAPLGLFHVCSPADICCFPSGVMDVPRLHVLLWFFSENILHCSFFFFSDECWRVSSFLSVQTSVCCFILFNSDQVSVYSLAVVDNYLDTPPTVIWQLLL